MKSNKNRKMSGRSSNVKQLLKSNVRWLNTSRRESRPSSRVARCEAVIEYTSSSLLLDKHGSLSSTGLSGTACELVRVTDAEGRVHRKFPHVLRQALLGAASARTNEKMSREFFGTLKRVGRVALREVERPQRVVVAAVPAQPARVVSAPEEPEVDAMEVLRLEMAGQEDWDAETEEERASREKKERKERRKRSLARWVARKDAERRAEREKLAATQIAAAWRGHVCRENVRELARLIASSHEPTEHEEDDAQQLREWKQDQAEAQGLTVEEFERREREEDSAFMRMQNEAELARWSETDCEEEDRYEREWEEYKAAHRLERMWG